MFSSVPEHQINIANLSKHSLDKFGLEMLHLLTSHPIMPTSTGMIKSRACIQTCPSPLMEFGLIQMKLQTSSAMESVTKTKQLKTQFKETFHTFQQVKTWRLELFH